MTISQNWSHAKVNQVITSLGTALATNKRTLRTIKDTLLDVEGAAVRYACDAVVAGTAGDAVDRWDTDSDLTWNAVTAFSWIVIRFVNMANSELLIALNRTIAD